MKNKKNHYSKLLLFLAGVILLFNSSCKKYEEVVVENNFAPEDQTVDSETRKIIIENYVNKVYISTLGREPDSLEKVFGINLITSNNISMSSRNQLLDSVFIKPDFKDKFYERARLELLQGLDTAEITQNINTIELVILPSIANTPDSIFIDYYLTERDRLVEMKEIPDSLHAGVISYVEVHRRCVNNMFYDQLNMGAFNFVVSLFQHFLDRYPTTNEQNSGAAMVNGSSAVLFLVTGQSKNDLLDIFFASDDYYEGQVRSLYRRYLYREPTTIEMSNGTLLYLITGDYIQLQKSILTKNEYIGI
ncbi:MAG: hypothetical protein JJE25_02110 [Bacteroidia bacterium]|nr:hypothetical protein [Bacteroidia bacterium]